MRVCVLRERGTRNFLLGSNVFDTFFGLKGLCSDISALLLLGFLPMPVSHSIVWEYFFQNFFLHKDMFACIIIVSKFSFFFGRWFK